MDEEQGRPGSGRQVTASHAVELHFTLFGAVNARNLGTSAGWLDNFVVRKPHLAHCRRYEIGLVLHASPARAGPIIIDQTRSRMLR